jgi:nucleoside-diphosphate-sugar epimerase
MVTAARPTASRYVDDLIEGLLHVMASAHLGPLNIGDPSEGTIVQLAELIQALIGTTKPIDFRPLPEDDPKQRCPDITLVKTVLGWEPQVPLAVGPASTIASFHAHPGITAIRPNGRHPEQAVSILTGDWPHGIVPRTVPL